MPSMIQSDFPEEKEVCQRQMRWDYNKDESHRKKGEEEGFTIPKANIQPH